MRRILVLLVGATVLAACGGDATTTTTVPPTTSSPPTTVASTTTTEPATTTTGSTTTAPETTTTAGDTTTTLAGEPIDFGPRAGDELIVVRVAHDDVLDLRAGPGTDQEILTELEPTATGIIAQGATRQLSRSMWIEVEADGTTGWVSLAFVAYEGATDDATAATIDELGERPTAPTMSELGLVVAEAWASEEPESDVVKVVDETLGDLGEVTYDVIGLGDDAVFGFRFHVFGEPVSDGFSLRTVERTLLCGRGVDADGLCP